jgi:hypothetical protein
VAAPASPTKKIVLMVRSSIECGPRASRSNRNGGTRGRADEAVAPVEHDTVGRLEAHGRADQLAVAHTVESGHVSESVAGALTKK